MHASRFVTRVLRSSIAVAALMWGSTATPAQSRGVVRFEGARPSLVACLSARTAVATARDLLKARDESYQSYVDSAQGRVEDAMTASENATWPTVLRRRRLAVDRYLAAAARRLAKSELPEVAAKWRLVARHLLAARHNVALATRLLYGAVPDPRPDLTDTVVITPPEVPAPGDFMWTELAPSPDSLMIYVSSSIGDDAYDGLSPAPDGNGHGPKATPHAGQDLMRSGYPDWLHFKCGDTWHGYGTFLGFPPYVTYPAGQYTCVMGFPAGRSATEPAVITSYGTGPRPFLYNCQLLGPQDHSRIVGLHMERFQQADQTNTGVYLSGGGTDVLIEDCYIGNYINDFYIEPYFKESTAAVAIGLGSKTFAFDGSNLSWPTGKRVRATVTTAGVTAYAEGLITSKDATQVTLDVDAVLGSGTYSSWSIAPPIKDFRIRGCVVVDAYSSDAGTFRQGIAIHGVDGLLIEGCVIDHNGWKEGLAGAESNSRSHNMYVANCLNVVVRNNISSRSSNVALGCRSGGVFENNLTLNNPLGIACGYYLPPDIQAASGVIRDNVILDGADIQGTDQPPSPTAQGWAMALVHAEGMEVSGNIVSHNVHGGSPEGILVQGGYSTGLNIHDNIIYKWGGLDFQNNAYSAPNFVANNTIVADSGFLVAHSNATLLNTSVWQYSGNKYYSTQGDGSGFYSAGAVLTNALWIAASGETNATFTAPEFPHPEYDIASYDLSIGGTGSLVSFLTEARKQSRATYRIAYTARAVNNYIRAGYGMPAK